MVEEKTRGEVYFICPGESVRRPGEKCGYVFDLDDEEMDGRRMNLGCPMCGLHTDITLPMEEDLYK